MFRVTAYLALLGREMVIKAFRPAHHPRRHAEEVADRWLNCVEHKHFTKGGWWKPIPGPLPGSLCDSNSSNTSHFSWLVASRGCSLHPLSSPVLLFNALDASELKSILLIGDSFTQKFYATLESMRRECQGRASGVRFHYHHSDFMAHSFKPFRKPLALKRHHFEPPLDHHPTDGHSPAELVERAIAATKPDCIIMNWGAHYGLGYDAGSAQRLYANDTETMAETVAAAIEKLPSNPLVVWRSTPSGHPSCSSFLSPLRSTKELTDLWTTSSDGVEVTDYLWNLFIYYNYDAERIWKHHINNLVFMDAAELAKWRADLHIARQDLRRAPSSDSTRPKTKKVKEPDCLHYLREACNAGRPEMDVWWATLFFNIIEARAMKQPQQARLMHHAPHVRS